MHRHGSRDCASFKALVTKVSGPSEVPQFLGKYFL